MAGHLAYRITQHPWMTNGMSITPHVGRIVKTGNIIVGSGASAPVSIPKPGDQTDTTITFQWGGASGGAYVEIAGANQPAPAPTGAHATEDAKIRVYLKNHSETTVPVPAGGSFAVIEAAPIFL